MCDVLYSNEQYSTLISRVSRMYHTRYSSTWYVLPGTWYQVVATHGQVQSAASISCKYRGSYLLPEYCCANAQSWLCLLVLFPESRPVFLSITGTATAAAAAAVQPERLTQRANKRQDVLNETRPWSHLSADTNPDTRSIRRYRHDNGRKERREKGYSYLLVTGYLLSGSCPGHTRLPARQRASCMIPYCREWELRYKELLVSSPALYVRQVWTIIVPILLKVPRRSPHYFS